MPTRCLERYRLVLVLALCFSLPGCGGCWKSNNQAKTEAEEKEREEKQRQQKLPAITVGRLQILPLDAERSDVQLNNVKPGHWLAALQPLRANHEDMQVDVLSYPVDSRGQRVDLHAQPYQLMISRPAALPKSQGKVFETMFFVPPAAAEADSQRFSLQCDISARRGGEMAQALEATTTMPEYQYHLVVLAETPDQYTFFRQRLYALSQPEDDFSPAPPQRYYRVSLPTPSQASVPLPTNPLAWTSIACLVWDDFHPSSLSTIQQQALIDWLHWGGQIIMSGPGSLEKLQGSVLQPYLPATRRAAVELTAEDLAELNEHWSLTTEAGQRMDWTLDGGPVSGLALELHPEAQWIEGTGQLVAERRVGAGRIVLTAFPLAARATVAWPCYDAFFSAALLRHPARVFRSDEYSDAQFTWAHQPAFINDPRFVSRLRYFSRDAGQVKSNDGSAATSASPSGNPHDPGARNAPDNVRSGNVTTQEPAVLVADRPPMTTTDDWRLAGCQPQQQAGVAGWSDFSAVSNAARQTIRAAAGISVPESSFVLRVVAVYLLVLTVVNWGFFRLIGRVELAWVAAPIIALIASAAVVRLAQLDIGFARSRTEVGTLEIQGDYPRAHLTRYTALYTSLSTNFDFTFDDSTALVGPLARDENYRLTLNDPVRRLQLRRDRKVRLSGFPVLSNSTGMVHSEQMWDMQGSFELRGDAAAGWTLANGTGITLMDAAVFRRAADQSLEVAWLGTLQPRTSQALQWTTTDHRGPLIPQWEQSPTLSEIGLEPGQISLKPLLAIAADTLPLAVGDIRLVAWTDRDWEPEAVAPAPNQTVARTLVLAHLKRGPLPAPERDLNLYIDVLTEQQRTLLEEEALLEEDLSRDIDDSLDGPDQ